MIAKNLITRLSTCNSRMGCSAMSTASNQEVVNSAPKAGRLLDEFASQPPPQLKKTAPTALPSAADSGSERADRDMVRVILAAVANCEPMMKVQTIRKGTKVIHVPKVLFPEEQRSLAVRWIVQAVHQRKEASPKSSMAECLALELLLAYKKEGAARLKRDELHKLALENKSNASGYTL